MSAQHIIDPVIAWLKTACTDTHGAMEIEPNTDLAQMGALDSIQILELVLFIEEQFGAIIPLEQLVAENFATPSSIAQMTQRAQT